MDRQTVIALSVLASIVSSETALDARPVDRPLVLAQQAAAPAQDDSPEAKMNRRFPQKVRVGDLIGLPVQAPTWSQGSDETIPDNETIRIALGRR